MNSRRRRKARRALVASMVALMLSGCSLGSLNGGVISDSLSSSGEAKVTLTFVYSGTQASGKSALSRAVDGFMAEHPDIEIEQDSPGTGSYLDYLQMKDVTGEFPDMMEMPDTQIYAASGRIARLPNELASLFDHPVRLDGAVYALPLKGVVSSGFLYNKEIFEQAGIKAEPSNWNEFLEACRKIKMMGISPLIVGGKDASSIGPLLNKLIMDHVLADDPNWNAERTEGKRSFSDPDFVAALEDFSELFHRGYVHADWLSTSNNQTSTILLSRKAAMIYTSPSLIHPILEADPYFKIGYFMPKDRDGRLVLDTLPSQSGLSISAEAAADPLKMAAFQAFVRYFYSPDHYSAYLEGGALPATVNKFEQDLSEPMQKAVSLENEPHISSMPLDAFWGENAMPPGFADWFYKQVRQWVATGSPAMEQLTAKADEEWSRLAAVRAEEANPVPAEAH